MSQPLPRLLAIAATIAVAFTGTPASAADDVSFSLKYGVLAGLTGDPAASGQGWNEATRLGVEYLSATLKRLNLPKIGVVLADSQDSQGSPQPGVEAAQKLVQIDHVNVIVGDFYSSVTSAAATAVAIPNQVLMFTGGTSQALSKLNTGPTPLIWQPVAADDTQGRVLARVIADAVGKNGKVNVGARNDAYGTNLSAVFKEAWTAAGGTIPKFVIYNHQQPTLDSEAQELMQGDPDAWLFIDFCQTFEKLAQPMIRTGKWDAAKSFGSDTLNDCQSRGSKNYPGMRATQANASSGASFPAFKALFEKSGKQGVKFQAFIAEAFDSVFIAFLAALEAKSSDPIKISQHVVAVTNDPGTAYTYEQLDQAIKAILDGQKIHFNGATGPINFASTGRVNAAAYDIWQHKPDGTASVVKTITFTP
ncbi:MAG: ABC transporter substrate-binding protein [Proteobacteria bacterium]|nr:ABC transporter substrate-binding protein [Pseudomonadota bacterium]